VSQREQPREGGLRQDAQLVRRLWGFVRPHQRLIWSALTLLLLGSAVGLAQPWILRKAIDENVVPGRMEGFGLLVAAYVGVVLAELMLRAAQTYLVDLCGQNALIDLRLAVFRHLQRLSSSFYDRTPTGRLIGRVTTDIESLQEMFASGVVTVLADLVNLAAILALLFWMSWKLTLVALLLVPVLLLVTVSIRRRVRDAYGVMIGKRSRLNAKLHEEASGMSLIQAFRREDLTRDSFGVTNAELRDSELVTVKWESILSAVTDMLSSITMALILWYGGGLALEALGWSEARRSAESYMTLGTLVAFLQYTERFFGPLNDLSMKYTVMQSAMTAADRIFGLMDRDEILPETPTPTGPAQTEGRISFRNVTFGYDPKEPVLEDLSFDIAAGESVAILGATGAGKTTILKLLTRLYDIQAGSIELDGVDIRDYDLHDLRSRVGIVPQDVFLFTGELVENIRLGHPEISVELAIEAANALHLDQIVQRFPAGYSERVRERGSNLSAGERQLIAFARVLAVQPRVLALDEATSNVDTRLEHLLQDAVGTLMHGRTSLIIAHRLSTVRDADRILVLHKGRLVESGRHEELLAARGFYWRLHGLQFAEGS
jgi:ATP-binding cassette subfamily B protein